MKTPVQNQKGLADLSKCTPQSWSNHPKGNLFFLCMKYRLQGWICFNPLSQIAIHCRARKPCLSKAKPRLQPFANVKRMWLWNVQLSMVKRLGVRVVTVLPRACLTHSDACHDRFRILLQEERMAKEASARRIAVPDTPAPDTPAGAPRTPAMPSHEQDVSRIHAPHPQNSLEVEKFFASCHAATRGARPWEKSQMIGIQGIFGNMMILSLHGKMNHVRPRERLYAPVGKDLSFQCWWNRSTTRRRMEMQRCCFGLERSLASTSSPRDFF